MTAETQIAIKVDVDTLVGTLEGVPRLVDMLDARGVKASFYFSLGPDNSGRAIYRIFTRPGFLAKQLRNKAPSAYGFKTMLYGTLLPAPVIGDGMREIAARLNRSGHETGLHAFDHVAWHDGLWKWPGDRIREEIASGVNAFRNLFGKSPRGFAAPAWRYEQTAAESFLSHGLSYTAATRGKEPFFPVFDGKAVEILEIPTTLPTADEMIGSDGVTPENLDRRLIEMVEEPGLHVLTIHAEMEGRGIAPAFERLLDGLLERGVVFQRLIDVAEEILADPESVPRCEVERRELPGRPGAVSFQAKV